MSRTRQRRAARGMSLVEALVTLALLAVVLLALAPLFSQSVNVNASSGQVSVANSLAREKLEELMLYPSTDPRLEVPAGATTLGPIAPYDANDLPTFWKPSTGETSTATTSPGDGWFQYPYRRTYTVEPYRTNAIANQPPVRATSIGNEDNYDLQSPPPPFDVPYYDLKLVTVTVSPTSGPFPGLRRTTQSAYVRFRNVLPN